MFNSFLRTRRSKRFNYTPRYYDPRKEALDDLIDRVKAEKEGKIPTKHQIKFDRQHGVYHRERASNIRILVIIIILSVVAFIMFY